MAWADSTCCYTAQSPVPSRELLPSCTTPLPRVSHTQGFYSVHGEAALFIARDFYRTLAVVKYLGGPPPTGTPGGGATTPKSAGNSSSSSKPSTPAGGRQGGLASVTLNRSLFEGVLRSLLLEGGQHQVELWEGAGANWSLAK